MAFDTATVALAGTTLGAFIASVMPYFMERMKAKNLREEKAAEYKRHSDEKQEDWRRQDEVAAQVAKAISEQAAKTDEVADQAKKAATLLVESNKVIAQHQAQTSGELHHIKELVNSNFTAQMEGWLAALDGQILLTKELHKTNRPSEESLVSLKTLENTAATLRKSVAERDAATAKPS
jgi:hypothetical protein